MAAIPDLDCSRLASVSLDRRNLLDLRTRRGGRDDEGHLVIDFPIEVPANAKALPEELPPVMPEFAKAQDDLGTVHFSRFMVEGEEKLLFLSDIDGEVEPHIERLVESAGPVFDTIFEHVDDPPATPVADNPQRVIKWLKHHVREPIDTYFANEDLRCRTSRRPLARRASRAIPRRAPLLTYWTFKSRLQAFATKLYAKADRGQGR